MSLEICVSWRQVVEYAVSVAADGLEGAGNFASTGLDPGQLFEIQLNNLCAGFRSLGPQVPRPAPGRSWDWSLIATFRPASQL